MIANAGSATLLITRDRALCAHARAVFGDLSGLTIADSTVANLLWRSATFELRLLDVRAIDLISRERLALGLLEIDEDGVVICEGAFADAEGRAGRRASPVSVHVVSRADFPEVLKRIVGSKPDARQEVDATSKLVGASAAIEGLRQQLRTIARFPDVPIMLLGETGTGKDLVASVLHALGGEKRPFVPVNCSAIPSELFESELFGHAAGAFTDAKQSRRGLVEASAGGTLFLDEIGDMPSALQPKLLRALESKVYRRVGDHADVLLDARIMSATQREPRGLHFRADLYFRLAGFTLVVPPLRSRPEDIMPLARRFLADFSARYQLRVNSFRPNVIAQLQAHSWPGNVRELRTAIEGAAIMAEGESIEQIDFADTGTTREDEAPSSSRLPDVERALILRAVEESKGNLAVAAKALGIARSTLRARLKRLRAG